MQHLSAEAFPEQDPGSSENSPETPLGITSKLHRKRRNIYGAFLCEAARIGAQDPSQSLELFELHGTDIASW
jgi:hypothetical protein